MASDVIFEPLEFRNLTVKNRIFRSNIAGRLGNYDGSGSQARINWEVKFARGGVGALISSFTPVTRRGRILPNFATIESDDRIPFWRKLGEKVHEYDCKYIMQLSHSGRQQDVPGVENFARKALSSTNEMDPFHGILAQKMTLSEVKETIQLFADGARRAREAGLDGVELHAANGYLFTQFLSSAINDREDEYGGSLENRARFLLDVIRAIRKEVGDDFHLQVKTNAIDHDNVLNPFGKKGNTLEDGIQICKWAEEAGVDGLHISIGSLFPHPLNPPGELPLDYSTRSYGAMLASGVYSFRNYFFFRYRPLRPLFLFIWNLLKNKAHSPSFDVLPVEDPETRERLQTYQGINLDNAREIKKNVNIPVLCTGGFQQASFIRAALSEGYCDGVTIARPLVANNDLVNEVFAKGADLPERPCTYCNKCAVYAIAHTIGCYELSRFDYDYDKMIDEVMSVYKPTGFEE